MAITTDQITFVTDLFADLGAVTHRKMMGGLTLYNDSQIFAILSGDGQIYLKATGQFAKLLAAEGSTIFSMTRKDGSTASMGYWTLPDAALDDPELACDWAQQALNAQR